MAKSALKMLKQTLTGIAAASAMALGSTSAMAQTIDTGYFITFDLVGGAQGGYIFDSAFADVAKLQYTVAGSSVVLQPNFSLYDENPGDAFWRDNGGAGPGGNKWVEMLGFEERTVTFPFATPEATLLACASDNTLVAPYATVAFIKVFDPGYNLLDEQYQAFATGDISLSADLSGYGGDVIVQTGFSTSGPNANPADEAALGSVTVSLGAVCAPVVVPPPSGGPSAPAGVQTVPVLPLWALLGLTAIMGLFGARRLSKRD